MKRLPLSVFEEYFLHVDRSACPAWMFVECYFKGGFKHEALQEAVDVTMGRHPLFGCVARRGAGRWFWEPVAGWRAQVEWQTGTLERSWPKARAMDITQAPAFSMTAVERVGPGGEIEGTSLVWQLHHALCDSVGINLMVEDVLIAYARSQGRAVELTELHPGRLPGRDAFGLSVWEKLRMIPDKLIGLSACYALHRQKVATLTGGEVEVDGDHAPSAPTIISRRFGAEERRRISEGARRRGATSNDLFIRDFHYALGLWRKEQGVGLPTDWIQLVVPVSLRRPADRFLPAVNILSAISLSRSMRGLADRKRLLERTLEDMNWVKERNLGHAFITWLWWHRRMPGGIRRYARRPGVAGTATLSNFGQFFSRTPLQNKQKQQEVPGAVLVDIVPSTPLQPGIAVVLDVSVYAGRLAFDLTYDARMLSAAQAERLLELFLEQLWLSLETDV